LAIIIKQKLKILFTINICAPVNLTINKENQILNTLSKQINSNTDIQSFKVKQSQIQSNIQPSQLFSPFNRFLNTFRIKNSLLFFN
jgi:hypothetical protein